MSKPEMLENGEAPRKPFRAFATLAATAITATLALGAVETYQAYNDLRSPHYTIDLDHIVGGSER